MDSQHIKLLLEKYWKGETTAKEEATIKVYLQTHPEEFEGMDIRFLDQIDKFSALSLGDDFTDSFMEGLENEQDTGWRKVFTLSFLKSTTTTYRNIAATALILVTLSVIFFSWNQNHKAALAQQAETQQAYEQAKEALMLISQQLNKGAAVTYSLDKFITTQEKIKTENLK